MEVVGTIVFTATIVLLMGWVYKGIFANTRPPRSQALRRSQE